MSDKMECPVCKSYSSSVLGAVERGDPCPSCGTDANTILNVAALRERYRESELRGEVERLTIELGKVTAECNKLSRIVNAVRDALNGEA